MRLREPSFFQAIGLFMSFHEICWISALQFLMFALLRLFLPPLLKLWWYNVKLFLRTGLHYSHLPVTDFQWRSLNCELLKAEILGSAQTPQEICLWPGFVRGKPHIFYFHSFAINVFAKILFSDLEMQDHWQRWRQMIVLQRISSASPELGHKMHF